jgi:glycerol-3-phosphate dehydrogenase
MPRIESIREDGDEDMGACDEHVDVAIVGAGVAGCMVARELSKYQVRTLVLERELDVASRGVTKGSMSAIHADMGAPGSNRARLTVQANPVFERLCEDLGVSFERTGLLVVALERSELPVLEEIRENAEENGAVPYRPLTRGEVLALESNLSPDVVAGLYQPAEGMLYSFDLTIACFENAVSNGVEFRFGTELLSMSERLDGTFSLFTNRGEVRARFVVNAAGLFADDVARMVGDDEITVVPVRGQHLILDRLVGDLVTHQLWDCGVGAVVPTPHGNLLIGSTFEEVTDKTGDDCSTAEGRDDLFRAAQRLIPALDRGVIIRGFSGLRSINNYNDHVVQVSKKTDRLVNISLISGGVTASPAVAEHVADLVAEGGLELRPRPDFEPQREPIPDFSEMTDGERADIIRRDPRYGRVVCRCETVTEGEIVEAIRRGARTLDGIKYRVRAGMGRCQGGFCGPRVMAILARELGVGLDAISKGGEEAWLVHPRA